MIFCGNISMNSVNDWLQKVRALTATITNANETFVEVSHSMESIRNAGFQNNDKENIDLAYSDLMEAKNMLCDVQAGGRRSNKKRKNRKTRKHRS